jgi:hypothetical protein
MTLPDGPHRQSRHNPQINYGDTTMSSDTDRIRMLNDQLRQNLRSGGAVITAGIAALGPEAVHRLVQTIAVFDDFCTANDPHGEHDFGAFEFDGTPVMFKIDYYDKDLNFHSPDPADPAVTVRVITLMLAEEY